MRVLLRLLTILALAAAPLLPAAPTAAQPIETVMTGCHEPVAPPPAHDCCDHTADHLCCPAALAVLPEAARPHAAAFAVAPWVEAAAFFAAIPPPPFDQPPRAA